MSWDWFLAESLMVHVPIANRDLEFNLGKKKHTKTKTIDNNIHAIVTYVDLNKS
jgi:hypothetical protein